MGPLLVLALSLVASCHAFSGVGVFPLNKEVIYTYQADINAGTRDPSLFESNYLLQGELHIQGGENVTTVFLKETSLHMHNGGKMHREKHDNLEHIQTMRIPAEASDLEKVFQIQYDVDGRVLALITDERESMWSVNIKKALASILQLDLFHIDLNKNIPHSFNCDESTIYGRCNVGYTVLPQKEDMLITKTQAPNTCTGYKSRTWFNMDEEMCQDEYEEPISSSSERVYWVVKETDGVMINKVKATGGIIMHPLNGNSEIHFIHVNQTLIKKHVINIEKMRTVENTLSHKLTFTLPEEDIVKGIVPDLTLGRNVKNMDLLMPKMRNMVGEAVDYLEENHIEMEEPDTKHGQTLGRLMTLLRFFEKSHLEHCYTEFAGNTSERGKLIMNLFLRLLPQVGTRASVMFCKELVMKHKVKDARAIHMIIMMPMRVNNPDTTLLTDMEELMKLGEEGSDLRKAGVLSFATLCYRTFKNDPNSKKLNEYVKMYYDRLLNAKDYSTQLLYIEGLRNIELGNVVKYLEGIINWTTPLKELVPNAQRHLRTTAIWACMKALQRMDTERVHNMMMPILLDRENHLDCRTAALTVIMQCKPTMQTMLNLFWIMRIEPCQHLYNFYYTKLLTLSQTTNNCLRTSAKLAKQMIRLLRVPNNTDVVTESQMLDYTDKTYGFGGMLTITNIGDDKTNVLNSFFIKKTSRMFNKEVNDWSFGVKMEGIGNCFQNNLVRTMMKSGTFPDFKNIIRDVQECIKNNVHIEITAMCQNRVIMTYHTTKALNIIEDFTLLKSLMETMKSHSQVLRYEVLGHMVMPTDFGVATLLKVEVPQMMSMKNDMNIDTNGPIMTAKIHTMTRYWSHACVVLEVYNPILDTWHGIRRLNSLDMSLPWNLNMVLNMDAGSLKLVFNRNQDDPQTMGMISHVKSHVFIAEDKNDMLTKLCNKCEPVMTVTKGEQFKNKLTLLNMDDKNTGYKYEIGLFDCERSIGATTLNKFTNFFMETWNKNVGTMPMGHLMLGLRHWFMYTILSPPVGSCGYGMRAVPSKQFPVTHIDINLRLSWETVQESLKELRYPTNKWNIRGTYFVNAMVNNKETVVRSWDMNTKVLNKAGQIFNDVDMQITRVTPNEKDLKICLENKKNFKLNAVEGIWNLFMGFTNEENCVKDQAAISIDWTGVVSKEQREIDHDDVNTYKECQLNPLGITGEHPHKWHCTVAHTSLRQYEFDITHQNLPTEMQVWLHTLYTWFRSMNVENFRHTDVRPYHLNKNTLKVFMNYPINKRVIDFTIHEPHESYEFTDLNYDMINWMLMMEPENSHFPYTPQLMHKLGMMNGCEITNDRMTKTLNEVVIQPVSNDWTLYATDRTTNSRWRVMIKKIEGKKPLALRLMVDGHTKDILPYGDEYVFTTSESMMFAMESGFQKMPWYAFNLLRSEDTIMMSMHNFGLYIEYNGHEVHIHMSHDPRMHLSGKCFEKV